MAKLILGAISDDKPIKVALELPASVHGDLAPHVDCLNSQHVSVAFVGGVSRG
jgi:hypothetical protein